MNQKRWGGKYLVSLLVVSPQQAGKENLDQAFSCCGIPEEHEGDIIMQVLALAEYGVFACVLEVVGDNLRQLLHKARQQAQGLQNLFGFYLDAPQNLIGATGWDTLQGNLYPQQEVDEKG
jgi:hypothetical protein